jgi:phosphoribosylformylglycinamidine cyclo-ligase
MTTSRKAYASAGVDVDLGNRLKRRIQSLVKQTHGPQVLGHIGGFGGLFRAQFQNMREPVLVASIDGVGTKLKIAFAMNKHDTVGADLVNHCVNDIAVLGARPLFFNFEKGGHFFFLTTSAAKNLRRAFSINCCADFREVVDPPAAR